MPRKRKYSKSINVLLSELDYAEVEKIADNREISISDVVREAVKFYLANHSSN